MGSRYGGIHHIWDSRLDYSAVVVSVEYRVAPENPDSAPLEDCYTGLEWVASHASEMNVDTAKIMVAGVSVGGGLAAGGQVELHVWPDGESDQKGVDQKDIFQVVNYCLLAPQKRPYT
ncbi:hypothetical protein BHE90_004930 [Fusarium euwallaceae]|uniref:Alpha/beta hydrolase fold-3 domain-containing protein n=1 Tax=Fusarium euwallaceae TaxID=1147111 RepID=A0A430LXV0_9HYPO|nr:hypothetical protein BHE90_004930 [Fusarium euwallaceae]